MAFPFIPMGKAGLGVTRTELVSQGTCKVTIPLLKNSSSRLAAMFVRVSGELHTEAFLCSVRFHFSTSSTSRRGCSPGATVGALTRCRRQRHERRRVIKSASGPAISASYPCNERLRMPSRSSPGGVSGENVHSGIHWIHTRSIFTRASDGNASSADVFIPGVGEPKEERDRHLLGSGWANDKRVTEAGRPWTPVGRIMLTQRKTKRGRVRFDAT